MLDRRLPIVIGISALVQIICFSIYLSGRDISHRDLDGHVVVFDIGEEEESRSLSSQLRTNKETDTDSKSIESESPPQHVPPTGDKNDVKIVAFTDKDYSNVAEWWYQRMTNLTYDTHTLILIDPAAEEHFQQQNAQRKSESKDPIRTETWLVDPGKKRKNKTRALWYRRIQYCLEQLKAGQSLLLTDVDNIFRRYVPLSQFQESPYDAIYALEQRFPEFYFRKQGFVFCGGMTFLKATDKTIAIMEEILELCDGDEKTKRCDDQKEVNKFLHFNMQWDVNVKTARKGITNTSNDLIQDGFEGVSIGVGKGFRAKVWDREFAWRADFEESCPPVEKNWVAMPANPPHWVRKVLIERWPNIVGAHGHGYEKIARVNIWEHHCNQTGTYFADEKTKPTGKTTIELALERFKAVEMASSGGSWT